ncbi:Putative WD repeat-containing protein WDR18/Ipi3/RID3 [Septoria linicola]|uniref:Pre-rRNA-processing protein IPI3 n=1 Tax=Septoria linicola TaxID=215465 RepID=A0A9Q9APG6_9PEZI|nr:putative WD repeat-containing protein WDR18/Ipi3/RID3 [Septoria linicola]USW50738.1 Putative WD repeat-containing protein WDR18/Ipi3/RID3 [Septoria linicola]
MLSEHFVASIGAPTKAPGTNVAKDAGIFLHEFQPLSQQRAVFKKSATAPNCLAISRSHIFAAQADKGVVHVYNREKGNQEAAVPFTEKISSIVLACDDAVLILGTVDGRVFLWETCTGRQVTTSQAHLQAVTALAVDATSTFLLSASKDATVHVWSIPQLLSFANTGGTTPLRTFSSHHSEITGLVLGHGAFHLNFAVSVSKDRTCLIWDYRSGNVLRTYLLPGVPLCAALDPADRAVYLGYDDGNLQQLNLYASPTGTIDAVQNGENAVEPMQPSAASRWRLPEAIHGAAMSIDVAYDGSMVVSGHASGAVLSWDVARGSFTANLTPLPLPGPANNVVFLPVSGHQDDKSSRPNISVKEVVKPKFGAFDASETGSVPGGYAASVQFTTDIGRSTSEFQSALNATTIPTALLDQGLEELSNWGKQPKQALTNADADGDDFMSFAESADGNAEQSLQEENTSLKTQLEAMRRLQKKSFEKLGKLSEANRSLSIREQKRLVAKGAKTSNGAVSDDSD